MLVLVLIEDPVEVAPVGEPLALVVPFDPVPLDALDVEVDVESAPPAELVTALSSQAGIHARERSAKSE
ncbi:MAG: hypothetical protein U0414_00450 [Polyangiaceae bacterium]